MQSGANNTDADVALGARFHAQLEQFLPATHADDVAHDRAVGRALRMGLRGEPDQAREVYNKWAVTAGYQPIEALIPSADGWELVFATQRMRLSADGTLLDVQELSTCQS